VNQHSGTPRELYRERLTERRQRVGRLQALEKRISGVRLVLFVTALLLLWPVLFAHTVAWPWLLLPLTVFVVVLVIHDRTIRTRVHQQRAAEFYERGLARLDDSWPGQGTSGAGYLDPSHPYAADLDLFGRGSLFELLCTARTLGGERTLARWLTIAAPPDEVRERQAAVAELRERLDLREALAVLGGEVGSTVDPDDLQQWSAAPRTLTASWPPWVAGVLALINLAAVVAWFSWRPEPLLAAGALSIGFVALFFQRVRRVFVSVDRPERDLLLLSQVLSRLEQEQFASPRLAELRRALDSEGAPPSRRIAALARLVELNDSRRNMLFAPLSALLLLGTQLAFAMERWRAACGPAVERWVAAVGEFEALSAFAGFAYEHPDDPFPEVTDGEVQLNGEGLAHPLLPESRAVRNDVTLAFDLRVLMVSGSNMSGKSTLLRTVGINAVLALAGAPVRARRLVISPLSVGACMRVQDSLQDGMSHFYAEITRLRKIVDLCDGDRPVLFLLDEILHGTNSHDRRIGAEALIHGLVDRDALGLVTTHDLALAQIAADLAPRAANVHFADHLEGDRMLFDYRLHPGVVRKSNALDLMRAVGLKV